MIRKTLKTKTLSVAKLRLADLEKHERGVSAIHTAVEQGKLTFKDALQTYQDELNSNPRLKPNAIRYRNETVKALVRTWPELKGMDVRKITETECKTWGAKFAREYSATLYNNTVGTLRQVLAIAIKAGAIYHNPAQAVPKVRVRAKELQLPEPEQFAQFITVIATAGARQSRDCANLVRFLAYGGFRKGEAENVTWNDCDFTKQEIVVRGDPEYGTKSSLTRRVPMIPEMAALLKELKEQREGEEPVAQVMRVQECQNAMNRAAKLVGMPRITHHDLRHLFATRCIESGVDIPTVSRWLGHKDGGALAMKVYGHLRDAHSSAMAQKVTFAVPKALQVIAVDAKAAATKPKKERKRTIP
ncbi:MAG: site-specific integrase [Proteobacteria bacterium]|nr:site-specific integrase [Pseudomonadota bacterium]